jgi:large subunit ribosomal protein L19
MMAKEKHKDKAVAKAATKEELQAAVSELRVGSDVKISHKIIEGDKERIQVFQGMIIQMRGDKENKSITVRKMTRGIGIERIFPLNSPVVTRIEIKKHSKVRRAKLYYIRKKKGQESKLKEIKVEAQA